MMSKAVLQGTLKGAQFTEPVKSRLPAYDLYEKSEIF